jgi:hypothetical protein
LSFALEEDGGGGECFKSGSQFGFDLGTSGGCFLGSNLIECLNQEYGEKTLLAR